MNINYNEVLDKCTLKFFNSIINMNETIHPDPPSDGEIERLHTYSKYLKNDVEIMKASVENKHATKNDEDPQQVFDKNVMENIVLVSKLLTKLSQCTEKLQK